jgi:hypothetical protein
MERAFWPHRVTAPSKASPADPRGLARPSGTPDSQRNLRPRAVLVKRRQGGVDPQTPSSRCPRRGGRAGAAGLNTEVIA